MSANVVKLPIKPKHKPWIVVENAGGDEPRDIREFDTMLQAFAFCKRWYDGDEFEDLDVMVYRVLPDGERTTEF